MGRLDGKIALITGAARGQGECEARLFAAEGAKVLLTDVLDEGAAVAESIGAAAAYTHLDVTSAAEWQSAVALCSTRFGVPNVLVNNAGIMLPGTLLECDEETFRKTLDINLTGAFLGIQTVARAMIDGGGGGSITDTQLFQIKDDVSLQLGTHAFKLGANFNYLNDIGLLNGNEHFATLTFFDDPSVIFSNSNGRYPQGFQTPGIVRTWQQANPVLADSLLDGKQVMAWFQDDWRVNPSLTLNLGIRWDADFNFYDQQHYEQNATRQTLEAIGDPHAALPKTPLKDFSNVMSRGIIAIGIDKGDELVGTTLTDGNQIIFLASHDGQAIRFDESDVRDMGRPAYGVRGMKLDEKDYIVGMATTPKDLKKAEAEAKKAADEAGVAGATGTDETLPIKGSLILSVTENGYGKRTAADEYRLQGRGGSGVINVKTTERNGRVVGIAQVTEESEVMLISQYGKIIRMDSSTIRESGRSAQGVRLLHMEPGDRVAAAVVIPAAEEEQNGGLIQ